MSVCGRCYLRTEVCPCAELSRGIADPPVLILRHAKEKYRTSNTARWVELVLDQVSIVEWGMPEGEPTLRWDDGACLLFSDGKAEPPPNLRRLVLVDGSWAQARRMVQRIPGLAALPRWALPLGGDSVTRLRRAPMPGALSTIEAVIRAFSLLGRDEAATTLEQARSVLIERALRLRGAPQPRRRIRVRPFLVRT